MRHRKAGRRLGRNSSHRLALMRSLTMALIRHERIITTVAKAKEVRPFVEKLVTLAKKGTLHARRMAASRLGPMADAEVKPGDGDDADHRPVLVKLFADIGPRFADRPGGYTRILKRQERRLGDAGHTAFIEFLKEGEQKRVRAKAPAAPRVEDEEETGGHEEHAPPTHGEAPAGQGTESAAASGEAQAQQPPAGGTPTQNPPHA